MEINEFQIFVKDLCTYFERAKAPTPQSISLWYNRVRLIRDDALPVIRARIIEDCDTFPKNLPKLMWEYNQEYRKAEGMKEVITYKDCQWCNGEGEIFVQKKHKSGEYYTRYVFRCDQCKQNKCTAYPWGNKLVLINQGYEDIPETEGSEKITNIHELQVFLIDFAELPF